MIAPRDDDKADSPNTGATDVGSRITVLEVKVDDLGVKMGERFEQVDRRFEQVDRRFEQVDKRFEKVDARFLETLKETKAGFEAVHRTIIQTTVAVLTAFIVGFGALVGLIATQL